MRTQSICLALAIVLICPFASSQWVQTNGPSVATLGSIAADAVGHVYAASDSQWFRSTNDGDTWESMPLSTAEWAGGKFCIGRGNIVFAGTWHGLSHSSTFGTTWGKTALVDTGITALYVGTDGTVYAGTALDPWGVSVSRSTDDGVSWVQCAPSWSPSTVMAIATTLQGTMFVAQISHISLSGSIMRSTDAGLNWDTVYQCVRDTNVVALAAGPDGTIFAGTAIMNGHGNVLRSTDNGRTWTSLQTGLPDAPVFSFVFAGSGHVLLSTVGVYASTDNGTRWTPANAGLPQTSVYALAMSGSTLFAGTLGKGIWRIPLLEVTTVEELPAPRPVQYVLSQNYPNPFNPSTTIKFELPKASQVSLTVFDILGCEVSVLVNDRRDAGVYELKFDGSNRASGVYFYRLQTEDYVATKKLLLMK